MVKSGKRGSLRKELENLSVRLRSRGQVSVQLLAMTLQPSIVEEIQLNQKSNAELQRIKQNLDKGNSLGFLIHEDGTL